MQWLVDYIIFPSMRFLECLLLALTSAVNASGLLDTSLGHRAFLTAYRIYKRITDWQILFLLKKFVPEGSNVIDVGANVGVITLWAAKCVGESGQVVAIEPELKNIQALKDCIKSAGMADRVLVYEAVAADIPGTLNLRINRAHPADHRIDSEGVPVQAVSLDGVVDSMGLTSVAFVKIDVQGAEPLVLQGAKNLLRSMRPVLWVEVSEFDLKNYSSTPQEVLDFLESYDFVPHLLRGRAIIPASYVDIMFRLTKRGYTDVLFIPSERIIQADTV
ncbi:MAG: FkbM family methyltransferase [Candidatus Methylumidiphilus sp.]